MDCLKMDVFGDEDIEMMETDDIPDNVSPNKRKFNSVNETIDVSNTGNKSPKSSQNLELRPVLKARRLLPRMPSIDTEESNNFCVTVEEKLKPICVLDTNILLSNLTDLKNVILVEEKLRQTTTKSKLKSIVIPWIVVQELDRMKTRKVEKSVVNVIHFINEQLKKSKGLIKGENEFHYKIDQKSNKTFKKIEEEMNDDKIINCCLKLKTITESNNLILITNDMNLCNKALMTQLKANNWMEFFDKYKSSDLYSVEIKPEDEYQIEPKNKRIAKNRSKITEKFSVNKSCGQLIGTTLSRSAQKPTSTLKSTPTLTRRQKSPNKRKSSPENPSKTLPQSIDLCNNSNTISFPNDIPLKYDDWIRFKDECEQKLLKFIEDIYREIWEKDWQKMLELDVNNTNLKEIIRVMRKEWNANFSDHFNRDNKIKTLVDSLHTSLLKSGANFHLYYKDLKYFVELVERKQSNLEMKALKSRKTI